MATNPLPQAPWGAYVQYVGPMTVEQFEQFPTEAGWVYELHEGRIIVMPGPGNIHGDIQTRFTLTLGWFIQQHHLGILSGTGCYNLPLPNNTEEVLCPDLSYVTPTRKATMAKRGSYLVGAPNLVIEIVSPTDRRSDIANKVATYVQSGVRMIWVTWPITQSIDIWHPETQQQPMHLGLRDTLDGYDVIPGFQCPVQAIFGDTDRPQP